MGVAFDVSANIGFDGSTYFCKRCGKAGYERATQVRGHLSLCPGTIMRKSVGSGTSPSTSSKYLQPLASGYNAGLSGGQPLVEVAVVEPSANPVVSQPVEGYEQLLSKVDTMAGEIATMQNHYNHIMGQINQPEYRPVPKDFFSQYKGYFIIGAIILAAIILSKQSNQCQAGSENKGINVGDIGGKALSKLVDVGITKGMASIFK